MDCHGGLFENGTEPDQFADRCPSVRYTEAGPGASQATRGLGGWGEPGLRLARPDSALQKALVVAV
jgi:hypothetical protein